MESLASPHVVAVPIHPAGHSIFFLLFSRRLADKGFTVTFVSSDKHISELVRNLGTQYLSPQRLPLRFLGLRDDSEHLTHHGLFEERKTEAGREKAIKSLVELVTDITSPKALQLRGVPTAAFPVCVVHDLMGSWAQEAAEKLQIEKHLLYTSPVASLSVAIQTKCLLDIGPLLHEPHSTEYAITELNLNSNALEKQHPCIVWLDSQEPSSVVYVCFGSHTTLQAPQLLELALGLEASGQPFLWIMCPSDSLPVELRDPFEAPTSMTQYLPPGFEERMKGRGLCYSGWAPQHRLLNHVAVGGFVTHCGWNSILESVCAGVPMLTWPLWADQNMNGRFLVDNTNLAVGLEREPIDPPQDIGKNGKVSRRVRKAEISRQIRRLMQDDDGWTVRQIVQLMKLNAQRAVAPGGSSIRSFEKYVSLLRATATAAFEADTSKHL